jgi:hypothetical protein
MVDELEAPYEFNMLLLGCTVGFNGRVPLAWPKLFFAKSKAQEKAGKNSKSNHYVVLSLSRICWWSVGMRSTAYFP